MKIVELCLFGKPNVSRLSIAVKQNTEQEAQQWVLLGCILYGFVVSCYFPFIEVLTGKFRHLKDQDVAKTENELKELKELLDNDTDKPFEEEFSNEILDNLLDRSELYEIVKGMKK